MRKVSFVLYSTFAFAEPLVLTTYLSLEKSSLISFNTQRLSVENYDAYFSTDNLCVLKEIKDDLYSDKYVVRISGSAKAEVEYNTKETFRIPEELFENLTSSRSSIYFEIVLIGYSESDNTYLATYTDNIRVHFEVNDNNTVKIID